MRFFVLAICLLNSISYAVKGPVAPESAKTLAQTQNITSSGNETKLLGSAEIRPSYKSQMGEFHSEDSVFLGYQFNRDNSVVYKQEFNTNIYDPKLASAQSGLNGYLVDGYLKEKVNNIYSSGNLSLGYEGRQYLPTWTAKRDAGMITALRNYAKLKYQASSNLALTFEEVPVVHVYQQAGSMTSKGPVANPIFENRASVGFEYSFSDKLKLIAPVLLSDVRTRSYSVNAANDSKWLHKVWVNPEVYYSVNSNVVVGMGYYSENLIKNNNFMDSAVGAGFEQGTTQLIFSTNL